LQEFKEEEQKIKIIKSKKKKAIPVQAWRGREASSGVRFPDFKTIGT